MCRRQICEPWGYGYPAMDALSLITPIKTASSARLVQRRSANNYGEKKPARSSDGPSALGIEWIAAHSPQAKERIERLFETLQDRLVKEMRLAGIDTIEPRISF